MGDAGDYKTPQSTGNRLRNRCKYDYATVHALVDSCPVLHVSFNSPSSDEPFPIILPMLGITGNFTDQTSESSSGPRHIYLHGHAASRLMKAPSNSGNADGLPVCIAGTLMDGLVLTYTPFHNSCNYRSVVAYGYAVPVTDEAERDYAMTMITDNLLPGRWANSRLPNKAELTSTGILRVEIQSASAKVRTGATGEDRKDLKDEKLRETTWVGVIPAAQQWGKPVPSEDNRVEKVPEYIESHIARENQEAKKYSEEAIHIK